MVVVVVKHFERPPTTKRWTDTIRAAADEDLSIPKDLAESNIFFFSLRLGIRIGTARASFGSTPRSIPRKRI